MDTGATKSCINYNTFTKIRNPKWSMETPPRVLAADGSDLGSMGIIQLNLKFGDKEVTQDFIVCRQLRCDIILGSDFGKQNCAGIEWTTKRTRVLSLNGISVVEVEENELGLLVTASFHVKVPPRHNGVFQVNVHGDTTGTHIITANNQFLERNPNVYQHEISIVSDDSKQSFPLVAVTNLDFAKTLHIGKGEIIGFARPESEEVVYIATANELDMEPYRDSSPCDWIPPRHRKPLEPQVDKKTGRHPDSLRNLSLEYVPDTAYPVENLRLFDESRESRIENQKMPLLMKVKAKELQGKNVEM